MEKKKNKKKTEKEKITGVKEENKVSSEYKLVNPRGRIFKGTVIKKLKKRVAIQFQRMIYVKKYERYAKARTKIHARLPENMEKQINVGDFIKVQECRPLSKIIHFIVIEKIKSGEIKNESK